MKNINLYILVMAMMKLAGGTPLVDGDSAPTTAGYDPAKLLNDILAYHNTTLPRQGGPSFIAFEGQTSTLDQPQQDNRGVKFEDQPEDSGSLQGSGIFSFEDQQQPSLGNQAGPGTKPLKKKRRRRRKPKRQSSLPGGYGLQQGFGPGGAISPAVSGAYNPAYAQQPGFIPGTSNTPLAPGVYNPAYAPQPGFVPGPPNTPPVPGVYNPAYAPQPGFVPGPSNTPLVPGVYNPAFASQPSFIPGAPIPGGAPPGVYHPSHGLQPVQNLQQRPHRRRRPLNTAEDALATVVRALGSIAQYDDFQCVPRMLCEVAGGKGPSAAGGQTPSFLSSLVDLQPLITLLAAYNGVSSSPLFVFGRAVFLGITSKGNAGTCRYAYPSCPTEPDKLVDYLNNHNGGFFRFFNGGPLPQPPPGLNGQQGIQQFYSQLSNVQGNINSNPDQFSGQYGLLHNQQQIDQIQQNYGLYNPEGNGQQNYGFQEEPNNYHGNGERYPDNYGSDYPYNNNYGYSQDHNYKKAVNEIVNNRLEKRIQNRPEVVYVDTKKYSFSNWSFPGRESPNSIKDETRVTKSLKFPEEQNEILSYSEKIRQGKGFNFPGDQSNRKYVDYYNYPPLADIDSLTDNLNKHNEAEFFDNGSFSDPVESNEENGVETIYVLRGNGDLNNPEVIKLRPGQKLA